MISENDNQKNPFAVQTPEGLSAKNVVSLFVDVFADFELVKNQGHTFLNGPRGSGKSMMFRYLEPDCQQLATDKPSQDLPFFAVHVPIKNTRLNLTEIEKLCTSHAEALIAEHYMVLVVLSRCINSLKRTGVPNEDQSVKALRKFCCEELPSIFAAIGNNYQFEPIPENTNGEHLVEWLERLLALMLEKLSTYLKKIAFPGADLTYSGPIGNFVDLLCPFINEFRKLPFLPDGPIYLLIDDADNLSDTQTRILNEWVATRSTEDVCLKVSTQLRYKTFRTITGGAISTPHDYDEINISNVYTSNRSRYMQRMCSIVKKRLSLYNFKCTPEEFFPVHQVQEKKIERIKRAYLDKGDDAARGARASDDSTRYARPDYIKELSDRRGGLQQYSYSGFKQLVHISSGVIRHFLDSAAEMYAEEKVKNGNVKRISPEIQNQVIRNHADQLFFREFDKILMDEAPSPDELKPFIRMRKLVEALGTIFFEVLKSDASERRIFSIALSDSDDQEVLDVLDLGVQYGYFHKSSMGTKKFASRTPLYILTRRLAPFFSLDPTSFAGYQSISTSDLREAMENQKSFTRKFSQKKKLGSELNADQGKLPL
ncbi:MAG: hypothetical protein OXC63_03775 [Aestuariivita sp.]|nr:hypothetical protein [Aestuariivita sp.]MCY4346980.1 hypothetical protein [Aestuariivita sp.]